MAPIDTAEQTRDLYLDLLKRSLTHSLYQHADISFPGRTRMTQLVYRLLGKRGIIPLRVVADPEEVRREGTDWPIFAQTMIGMRRLENLQHCIEDVLRDDVPGDLIETGVWRGGATILMRGVLKAHDVTDRTVWVADSFEGLPPPSAEYPADALSRAHTAERVAVSLEEVRSNFERYGLLDEQVRFLKGWFRDTLPTIRDRQWAVIRLDGDMYESTMDALVNLYDGLAVGGYLIVDDFCVPACRAAVSDFRDERGIREEIKEIDWTGVYWRREA